jgi:predicted RNase H-like HicB family nuclease
METRAKKYLEYKILITLDTRTGTKRRCYTAFVPVLGIAVDGNTVEETFENAKELIGFHLESLRKENKPIPIENSSEEFITTARIVIPA